MDINNNFTLKTYLINWEKLILASVLLVFPLTINAQNNTTTNGAQLINALELAKSKDQEYLAGLTNNSISAALETQANSLWLPQILISTTVAKANSNTQVEGGKFRTTNFGEQNGVDFDTSVNSGDMHSWAVSLKQNLYNPTRQAQSQQLIESGEIAKIVANNSFADLIIRVSKLSAGVMLAEQNQQVISEKEKALEYSKNEAYERFRLGKAPITDVHYANSMLASLKAQKLTGQMQTELAQQSFINSVGQMPPKFTAWEISPNTIKDNPSGSLLMWQDKARAQSPTLIIMQKELNRLSAQVSEHSDFSGLSVDLVAQISQKKLTGGGDYSSSAKNSDKNSMFGIQVSFPISTGGYESGKQQEATANLVKRKLQYAEKEQNLNLEVQSLYLASKTGVLQIEAFEQAVQASSENLNATVIGKEVGHRTVLDKINAENKLAEDKIHLTNAKVNWLINNLKLLAIAGELNEESFRNLAQGIK